MASRFIALGILWGYIRETSPVQGKTTERKVIRKKLMTRPGRNDWKLEQVLFINAAKFEWSRSNPKSRLVLRTWTPGHRNWLMSTYSSDAKNQTWEAEPFKQLLCMGDTFVSIESEGKAFAFIELDVDLIVDAEDSESVNENNTEVA